MRAAHTHGATAAEVDTAATHTHGTSATTAEVSATAAATTEMSAATASAANMSATAADTAASRVSSRRQTKRYGYCGRACRDFAHDTPHRGQMRKPTPDRPVRSGGVKAYDAAVHTRRLVHVAHHLYMCVIHRAR
jgi:hypothetical protein